jgi:hypothetical protein
MRRPAVLLPRTEGSDVSDCQATQAQETVTVDRSEYEALLAVATLYVDSFTDDDRMSLVGAFRYQEIADIVDKHGRRY